jgi:hypothetical protein
MKKVTLPDEFMPSRLVPEFEQWVESRETEEDIVSLIDAITHEIVGPQFFAGSYRIRAVEKAVAARKVARLMQHHGKAEIVVAGTAWRSDGEKLKCELLF